MLTKTSPIVRSCVFFSHCLAMISYIYVLQRDSQLRRAVVGNVAVVVVVVVVVVTLMNNRLR